VKFEIELHFDENDPRQWVPKIFDIFGYAARKGFKNMKLKPEGCSVIFLPNYERDEEELHPATKDQMKEFTEEISRMSKQKEPEDTD